MTPTIPYADVGTTCRPTSLGYHYHLFREAGWPMGSGVVEGACKHPIGLRFKRQSTRSIKAGARAVLNLALDRINDRWRARCHRMRTLSPA